MVDHDLYTDPTTGVLRNLIGATTHEALDAGDAELSWRALSDRGAVAHLKTFDLDHLRALHKHVFGKVYEWAGDVRTVNIGKGDTLFAPVAHIENGAKLLFAQLRAENTLKGTAPDQFSKRAGHYLGEINVLHPFREGNGHTQRLFMDQVAQGAGYRIGWEHITQAQMREACAHAVHTDASALTALIRERLSAAPAPSLTLGQETPASERGRTMRGQSL